MIAYVDTSVLLRILLRQPGHLKEFSKITKPIASLLLRAETLRTLDRLRVIGKLNEKDFVKVISQAYEAFQYMEFVRLSDAAVSGAGESFPVALGTLDAIHLVSAKMWKAAYKQDLVFLTHDEQLGKAALTAGFQVLGI